jgi:alpha-beta hydrolase superfamily lysophospholipase
MAFLVLLKGVRKGSSLARALADGGFNKPFKPNRTAFDWLSRDEGVVDAYLADPLCGKLCSVGFYRDLTALLNTIHRPERMARISRDLPMYVFGGSADPVGNMGAGPTALVNIYRSLGIRDLEFVLYPEARHEALNETNRDEVTENLLAWLLVHC